MHIYLKNNPGPSKFHFDPIWNDVFEGSPHSPEQKQQ